MGIEHRKLVWTPHFAWYVSTWWRNSLFIWEWFISLENELELPLIFVLFLKGKQNKKEKP